MPGEYGMLVVVGYLDLPNDQVTLVSMPGEYGMLVVVGYLDVPNDRVDVIDSRNLAFRNRSL